eukprot:scaffold27064_cov167-Skeletonema_menzelii.AAC.2
MVDRFQLRLAWMASVVRPRRIATHNRPHHSHVPRRSTSKLPTSAPEANTEHPTIQHQSLDMDEEEVDNELTPFKSLSRVRRSSGDVCGEKANSS